MKKSVSLLLMIIFLFSFILCGCGKNRAKNDYVINNDGIINIGVLLPLSGEGKALGDNYYEGIRFANELAPGVNIDNEKKHLINLIYEDINGDIVAACDSFKKSKVAAVICVGTDKENTDTVLESFKKDDVAILFTDCSSTEILTASNAMCISIPYSYQSSVAATYFNENGFKTGAVVAPDDDYGEKVAKSFKNTFVTGGGASVSEYFYGSEDSNFNANLIAGSELEFVFIVGAEQNIKELYLQLKEAKAKLTVVLSEVYDKQSFAEEMFDDVVYISKFEQDDNNYIGTDFIKSYSKMNDVSSSEITAATAYGYDAYMLIYGSLMSLNSNSQSASSVNVQETSESAESTAAYSSQVLSALKSVAHMGVTDSVSFNESGLVNTQFLYLGTIQNSKAIMLNKYNYSHETE